LLDDELQCYLTQSGVQWSRLDRDAQFHAENQWRLIYGQSAIAHKRIRHGVKAEYEYSREPCVHFLIVLFTSNVDGFPLSAAGLGSFFGAHECHGALVPLGSFCDAEFFVAPLDFEWTMIHTHEDHAIGGPYFIRREWAGA
jgi:hypothetical protein